MRIITEFATAKKLLSSKKTLYPSSKSLNIGKSSQQAFNKNLSISEMVRHILKEIEQTGDKGVKRLTKIFDNIDLNSIEVSKTEIDHSFDRINPKLLKSLHASAERIKLFHSQNPFKTWFDKQNGFGQIIKPITSAGIYVPGGNAIFPSTILMTAIPAKMAGVEKIIISTPPRNGDIDPLLLATAKIAGVDQIFQIGGAQAIAAMTYGTQTIPKVEIVCGPGNIFVTLAKKMVFGEVGVDGLFGPTETLIIADEHANIAHCTADLLDQAEHDPLATPILITTSKKIADTINSNIMEQSKKITRSSIAQSSLKNNGLIILVEDISQAIELSNIFAPEHLSLMINKSEQYLDQIVNAGIIFSGKSAHEVIGDYVAGPSHVMPTNQTAKFNSGINILTIMKIIPVVNLDNLSSQKLKELNEIAFTLAMSEGFEAHAYAAESRLDSL